jgi:hypothetical protein
MTRAVIRALVSIIVWSVTLLAVAIAGTVVVAFVIDAAVR